MVNSKLFFNTGWSGPSPARVLDEQKRVLGMRKNIETLRTRMAAFLGAGPDEIAITRSTTEAINIVLGGIEWHPGQKIVTTNIEHGAGLIPAYAVRDRYGVNLEIVDLSEMRDPLRRLTRAIDDRTRLVLVSHVSFNTGLRLPIKELAALCAERGCELLVDGAQAVGVFRIDLDDTGCDYYSFPGHKWMLGPDATGALYIRKDRIARLKLTFAGNESAKKADRAGNVAYHTTAKKFEICDFNAALIAGWIKTLDFLGEFGIDNIESAIQANTDYLKKRLARINGVRVITPNEWARSAGLVAIEIAGKSSRDAFSFLLKKGIITRFTPPPSYLRISVNYFNTREELDTLVEALKQFSTT
ncbi:MAG: aminotransferase class V-fold PLP-dependent enzyme [Candidatus Lindowbacteria bacterium]|nr:aminotransferase class V-fold PLP-dependent enzyme [Candidatus Lindowbacteria bacterium]